MKSVTDNSNINMEPEEEYLKIVPENIAVLPVRDVVVFPGTVIPLVVAGAESIKLIDDAIIGSKLIALFLDRSKKRDNSKPQ